ncbi:MAG: hypothetical protein ACLUVC_09950 [Longibaculum sp.]
MPSRKHKEDRASIFSSFDALKGFREYLKQKERIVVEKRNLSEDECEILNWKIHQLQKGMIISLIHFDHGEYIKTEGFLSQIDLDYSKTLTIVDKKINIKDIIDIDYPTQERE